jgi:hypothetical protein
MIPEKMSFSDKTSDLECKKVEAVETWFYAGKFYGKKYLRITKAEKK